MDSLTSKLQPATFAEFEREAKRGNVVAVSTTFSLAAMDPIAAFVKVAGPAQNAFLFESVVGGEAVANYSFLGANPYMIVRGRGDQTIIEKAGAEKQRTRETRDEGVMQYLRDHFRLNQLAVRSDLGPLAGGAVGYLGYGAAKWFEPALNKQSIAKFSGDDQSDDYKSDDALFMFYRTLVVFDRAQGKMKIVSVVFTDEAFGNKVPLRDLYQSAVQETERIAQLLAVQPAAAAGNGSSGQNKNQPNNKLSETPVRSNWTRENFQQAVLDVKEHIMAGDCYQVVLSQRFSRKVTVGPVPLYRALRQSNPAPYTYLLKLGPDAIIGASPELLVRCRGERLDYRPIAGTRKRGATEEEDNLLAEEMRVDEKEVAEHMMLVDLGRNDLGRVAEFGSVKVEDLMSVERYSKVQHLVSSLSARLRAGCDRFDALAACFPAGTVTGAPKVRAMEIIRELEPDNRGVYAGSILYADYADNLDSCIAIRTILLRQGEASVQAGAGIVADSVPEREYQETLDKAHALLRAIEIAEEEGQNHLR
ncbi:MAG TPA: anthranilate synthase component I family protein [Pyrinomonadaceae bacterium]|jgi:anthranilate synthase component 1|nr:anthranilate synthase component I family protein [Pyrinomonadaceae bacterium]